jgi:adenylylsulfate kinase
VGPLIWFTGLPSSGKTTLARAVQKRLDGALLLDGDEVRAALCPTPGYTPEERDHFYRTLTHLALILCRQNATVLVAATAAERQFRDRARQAAERFIEVYVDTPQEVCEARDSKGLYARVRRGELPDFPDPAHYQPPDKPELVAHGLDAVDAIVKMVRASVVPRS